MPMQLSSPRPHFLRAIYRQRSRRPTSISPWRPANLTLDRLPVEKHSETAWDNVIYGSPGSAMWSRHTCRCALTLSARSGRGITRFASGPPAQNRRLLLDKDWAYWKEFILNDLSRAHPDIRECVSRIDIMRIGHAMARPVPGSIFSDARRRLLHSTGNIIYANSDLSGFSIFEEAQYRGVRAAERALKFV